MPSRAKTSRADTDAREKRLFPFRSAREAGETGEVGEVGEDAPAIAAGESARFATGPFVRKGRFFVPDLSPEAHPEARGFKPALVFVAESPHVSEVTPAALEERRPLCGKAGLQWWGLLGQLLEHRPVAAGDASAPTDVSLERLLDFCRRHSIAIMNAVQYPLDPKVAAAFPEAEPALTIGFSKAARADQYKKLKTRPEVLDALHALRARLRHPSVAHCRVHALGNDSEWFLQQALGKEGFATRVGERIPHPSAWWRQGGLYGRIAREKLERIFKNS